jgi:cathepsin L
MVIIKLYSFILLIHIARSNPQFGGLGNVLNNPAQSIPGPLGDLTGSVGSTLGKIAAGLPIGFGDYKTVFKKTYIDKADELLRENIFKKVLQSVADHNELFKQGKEKFSLAINQFSDWTLPEYLGIMGMDLSEADDDDDVPAKTKRQTRAADSCQHPDEKDWRKDGAVTSIKDQLKCASCYAFSAAGALEAQFFLKSGVLNSLSEQQFVDCSTNLGNKGCNKGVMNKVFKYAKSAGISTDAKYPYEGKHSNCRASSDSLKISGYAKVPKGNEAMLQDAVCRIGPVSVAVDASDEKFKNYHDGVYFNADCNPNNTNHAVLVVGYGFDETTDLEYWIVKNSFGTSWGQEGYAKIAKNQKNHCGIANIASYPIV